MMASTITSNRHNILGASGGCPNPIVYFGPDLDLTEAGGPITAQNTAAVHCYAADGSLETYVPGGGSNDFTVMDSGFMRHGRGYVIYALEDFTLPYTSPSA